MTRKIAMVTVRTVLDMLANGSSYSQIRRRTGASNGFIHKLASAAMPDVSAFLKLSDVEIHGRVYPKSPNARIEPNWEEINETLKKKHMTLQLVYEAYCLANQGQKIYSYSSFCRRYADRKPEWEPQELFTNLIYVPGDIMEIDYAGDDLVWVDEFSIVHRDRVFVAALPASGLIYAQVFENERQQSWVQGVVDALEYFGGAPKNLLMDNAKALVRHPNWIQGDIQPVIHDVCEHYDMNAQTCRVRHPKDKNRVEASVNMVERWIIGKLHMEGEGHALAKDRNDLKEKVLKYLNELNLRPWQGRHPTRRDCFEAEEKKYLQPLPIHPYEHGEWKVHTVDKGHCIKLGKPYGYHRYSVPARFIKQKMHIKVTMKKVQIYDIETGMFIASHDRCYSTEGIKTHILPEHLTPQEKRTRLTPAEWIEIFHSKMGIEQALADKFVAQAFVSDFSGRRLCGAVSDARKSYSVNVIQRAMQALLDADIWRIGFFNRQCETIHLDDRSESLFGNDDEQDPDYVTAEHDNIRDDYE